MADQGVLTEKQIPQQDRTTGEYAAVSAAASPQSTDPLDMDKTLEETLTGPGIDKILSKRERQILEYIVEGNTNKEIAQKLYRTQRTVEYHRNRLMRKLDTHTTAELVKRAILMGVC
ncbi:MAG: response regulator transcription factor [Planctomycetota bacterium]|jgi:DNA-binding NarL/FixJ family response regulator